ncbi:hypothetical protein NEOLEDRAFT_1127423 [Neolentinus lepideus HHB14362 ss-1]|uniref:Uncharacterized protein n=1 Tax=Neolentinus lepideus HHB14362 ss-1 TaxID=1314782 RepID=A0A165VH45_9AGAM|nr:hypothetical protein NEOLEDRAFT_1127423 [Neolentinus lepideus HHB14362 ss-1]
MNYPPFAFLVQGPDCVVPILQHLSHKVNEYVSYSNTGVRLRTNGRSLRHSSPIRLAL